MIEPAHPVGQTLSQYCILRKIGDEVMSVGYATDDGKSGRHRALAGAIIALKRAVDPISIARLENHQCW